MSSPLMRDARLELRWATLDAAGAGLRALLSAEERARIDGLERRADRARSTLGAALLRIAMGERLRLDPRDVPVDRSCDECGRPHGPPRVPVAGAPWASISHSGLLVGVAIADEPVGLDVQRLADLSEPGAGAAWVRAEAVAKLAGVARAAGLPAEPRVVVRQLEAPLPGYAAALALPERLEASAARILGP